jgi:hypothetical protein
MLFAETAGVVLCLSLVDVDSGKPDSIRATLVRAVVRNEWIQEDSGDLL